MPVFSTSIDGGDDVTLFFFHAKMALKSGGVGGVVGRPPLCKQNDPNSLANISYPHGDDLMLILQRQHRWRRRLDACFLFHAKMALNSGWVVGA